MKVVEKLLEVKRAHDTGLVKEIAIELQLLNDLGEVISSRYIHTKLDGNASAVGFVKFESLTNAQVLSWGIEKLGPEKIKEVSDKIISSYHKRQEIKAVRDLSGLPEEDSK